MRASAVLLLFLLLFTACEQPKAQKPGVRAQATDAYRTWFGPPPTVHEGSCFALIGYLPLAGNPGQVKPLPFFLFVESPPQQMRLLIEHLIHLPATALPPDLTNPFPAGSALQSLSVQGDTADVAFSFAGGSPADPGVIQGMASTLGHSLSQFPGILRVRLYSEEKLLPHLAAEGFLPDPADVFPPDRPRPIGIVGVWESGTGPQEISVFFDRPISVQSFQLSTEDGKLLNGDYFLSAFDMAVLMHPAAPGTLAEGMPVEVDYAVADPLGRTSKGRESFPLRRIEHP